MPVLTGLAQGVLVATAPLGRDAARDAARAELTRQPYADAQPPLLLRLVGRALRAVSDLFAGAAARVGDGRLARLLLIAVVVGIVTVVLVRLGPLRDRRGATGRPLFDGNGTRTAAQHRAAADTLAGEGRWAEAVRERLRAVVREVEARGILDARPGRTADEVARDAGAAVPALADDLARAAGVFDEVWYGGRAAGPESLAALVAVDDRVRGAARGPSW